MKSYQFSFEKIEIPGLSALEILEEHLIDYRLRSGVRNAFCGNELKYLRKKLLITDKYGIDWCTNMYLNGKIYTLHLPIARKQKHMHQRERDTLITSGSPILDLWGDCL